MKTGLCPTPHPLPRCKSAVNATLNHLIMVPQAKTKLERAKSTADVLAANRDFQARHMFSTTSAVERRASLSPELKKFTKEAPTAASRLTRPAVLWQKPKGSISQPATPKMGTARNGPAGMNAIGSNSLAYCTPPQVKVTSQSDTSIQIQSDEDEECVRFMLNDV